MSTPSTTLTLKTITPGNVGPYAPTYADISRPGVDGERRKYTGKRGTVTTVTGHQFYLDKATAQAAADTFEQMQGQEIILASQLENYSWQVFLQQITTEIKPVISTTTATYQLRCRLTVQRTA